MQNPAIDAAAFAPAFPWIQISEPKLNDFGHFYTEVRGKECLLCGSSEMIPRSLATKIAEAEIDEFMDDDTMKWCPTCISLVEYGVPERRLVGDDPKKLVRSIEALGLDPIPQWLREELAGKS